MSEFTQPIDVLTATASDIKTLLETNQVTSVQVVEAYLAQIQKHNWNGLKLRAVISVSRSSSLKYAAQLDEERKQGRVRGPLHGIPVILKDCIQTHSELGMPTTGGAAVFKHAMAREDAEVVRRLREKGLIILGKASLTEYCGAKGRDHTTGWNSVNGQTQSAWIEGGVRKSDVFWGRSTPGGSSSGSGVGVAAGFSPLSVGTETGGSCCLPANRSGVYMLRISYDEDLVRGVLPLCKDSDSLGAFAKSAIDVELLAQDMVGSRNIRPGDHLQWEDLRIGFVEPQEWGVVPADQEKWDDSHVQIMQEYKRAIKSVRSSGAKCVQPVSLPSMNDFTHEGKSLLHFISFSDVRHEWPAWIAGMDGAPVKTLQDIIDWNNKYPELGMPEPHADQQFLLDVMESGVTPEQAAKAAATIRPKARKAIDDCLSSSKIDLIVGPADCGLCILASIGNCPSAIVPMTILTGEKGMGQPQGLMIISRRHGEAKMLEFMRLWETKQGPWQIPTRLQAPKVL